MLITFYDLLVSSYNFKLFKFAGIKKLPIIAHFSFNDE